MKKIRRGFTLIEMVIVLFIISLLMLIMIPNIIEQKDHANNTSNDAFKTTLKTQAELYLENNPNAETVTVEMLKENNYISDKQSDRAAKLNIKNFDDLIKKQPTTTNAK